MEEINILSESIIKIEAESIKIEAVKEELIDVNEDNCWNSFEELEPPFGVFIGPPKKEETSYSDEEKDPISSFCGSTSTATIKQEITSYSPVTNYRDGNSYQNR